jgi:hypothetical protein
MDKEYGLDAPLLYVVSLQYTRCLISAEKRPGVSAFIYWRTSSSFQKISSECFFIYLIKWKLTGAISMLNGRSSRDIPNETAAEIML